MADKMCPCGALHEWDDPVTPEHPAFDGETGLPLRPMSPERRREQIQRAHRELLEYDAEHASPN